MHMEETMNQYSKTREGIIRKARLAARKIDGRRVSPYTRTDFNDTFLFHFDRERERMVAEKKEGA
jgi:hypothetical protein